MKKIAVEEHWTNEYFMNLRIKWIEESGIHMTLPPEELKRANEKVYDLEQRLVVMDQLDIETQIIVSGSNGTEGIIDSEEAIQACKKYNDECFKAIDRFPGRYRAYAVLPMQDPVAAAEELERTMKIYGFVGGRISGYVQGHFLDEERFAPLFEKANELHAVCYLHPTETPVPASWIYQNCTELLGPSWSWGVDTATYIMRLAVNGVLDRYPDLQIVIGHMGEMIPYVLWRLQNRLQIGGRQSGVEQNVSDIIRKHVYISTSGNLSEAALRCAISEFGIQRILFSVDYPYEKMEDAVKFIDGTSLSDMEKKHIYYDNAVQIFGLK